jgi:hypothetical protein
MSTDAERARKTRRRKAMRKAGFVVVELWIKSDRMAVALSGDKFLKECDEGDPDAISAALAAMLDAFTVEILGLDRHDVTGEHMPVCLVGDAPDPNEVLP